MSHFTISEDERIDSMLNRARKHHVEIQRLWKRLPKTPQEFAGEGMGAPFFIPSSSTNTSATSESTSTATTTTNTTGTTQSLTTFSPAPCDYPSPVNSYYPATFVVSRSGQGFCGGNGFMPMAPIYYDTESMTVNLQLRRKHISYTSSPQCTYRFINFYFGLISAETFPVSKITIDPFDILKIRILERTTPTETNGCPPCEDIPPHLLMESQILKGVGGEGTISAPGKVLTTVTSLFPGYPFLGIFSQTGDPSGLNCTAFIGDTGCPASIYDLKYNPWDGSLATWKAYAYIKMTIG